MNIEEFLNTAAELDRAVFFSGLEDKKIIRFQFSCGDEQLRGKHLCCVRTVVHTVIYLFYITFVPQNFSQFFMHRFRTSVKYSELFFVKVSYSRLES